MKVDMLREGKKDERENHGTYNVFMAECLGK
jgi:hypothetical protein